MENYKVVFDFDGYGVLFDSKDKFVEGLKSNFVETYNQYTNAVNPNYEIWNSEAEAKGYEGSMDPESEYMKYICIRKNAVLKDEINKGYFETIRKTLTPNGAWYDWYIDENCEFHMTLAGTMLGLGYIDVSIHIETI